MTEQEVNNLIDSKIAKTKMSQLPEATQTSGLYSIGYNGNQSVKYKANLLQGDPLTVRKTYQTEAEALADKNPIDTTTSLPLKVGQFVSIVDDGEKNGIYRIGSISGDGTMSLELQGKVGDMSDYVKSEDLALKANHGYESNPKTLKEVDNAKADHGYASIEEVKTLKQVEDTVGQLADIATLKIKNLAINGNFSNGTAGWRGTESSISVEEGTLEMLSSSDTGKGRTLPNASFSVAVGDVIYRRAVVMSTSNLVGLGFSANAPAKHSGSGSYEVLSFVRDATSDSEHISVVDGRETGWDSVKITSMIAVNLTEVFGSGNEPSKSEMDELISQIGYFEGERSMSSQEMTQWQSYLFAKNERVDVVEEIVSQLEDISVIKMENLVEDGDFESGLLGRFTKTDGGGGASTLEINTVNPISGNYDAKLTITSPASSGRPFLNQLPGYVGVPENIYYFRFEAKIISGTPRLFGIQTGGEIASITGDVFEGLNSFTIECDGLSASFGRYYFRSPELWEMQLDNFMVINLTEVFGAGSEPSKMEFETLLDILGVNYFEGEMIVPLKELLRYIRSGTTTEIYSNFKDNLTNPNTGNVEVLSGLYGGDDAIYKIPVQSSVFRMVFDFYMNTGVNNELPHGDIVSFMSSGNVVNSIKTLNAKTTTTFRQHAGSPIEESSLLQVPKYNSGFTILGNNSVRDSLYHEPIVGETIFSIWLKGSDKPLDDFYNTNKVEGEQWLADREQWLSDYRDYAIVIEDDTFSIVRDGIDVTEDEGAFNGGSTSTIYSTSLKSEGEWRTLKSLYEELKSLTEVGGVLENFWMNFYALSSRKTCGDIHQFGKVKMVGRYYQQITNINADYGVTQQMRYDSFPVLVKYAVDDKKHVCEIVGVNGKIYAQVDGEMFSSDIPNLEYITIGGAIKPTNLEVVNGSLGDAEIVNVGGGTIISQRSPYTVGIMGHKLIDEMEGPGVGDGIEQSLTRMHDVCILLRERGYTVVSIDDLIKMRANGIYPSKRIAFFVFDDRRIAGVYQNFRNRQAISKYGYPANLASVMSGLYENDPSVYQPIITAMRGNGWNNLSHTYFHNVPYRVKNSVVLWAELKEVLRVADLLNMNNNALCYSFSAGWDVTHTMLEMSGFALAILNNAPFYSKLSRNKYMIARVNMADHGSNWDNVSRHIC